MHRAHIYILMASLVESVACGGGTAASGMPGDGGTANIAGHGGAASAGGSGASGSTGSAGNRGASGTGGSGVGAAGSLGAAGVGGNSGASGAAGAGGSVASPACPGARPDASNTGVPAGVSLTVVNRDVSVTQDGTVLDAQDIHGFLVIKASHVKVTRCIVRGGVATQNGAGIAVQSGSDILVEDSEVGLANPSAFLDGVSASNLTLRRSNIHGGVDGVKVGSNSRVECNFIHDMASFASDPNQGGGATHNDAIQILSGTGIHIVGNQLVVTKAQNAAIQVTQDFGTVSDLHIEANWADGGGCTFNLSHKGGASLDNVSALNNRFGRNSYYDCPILKSTKTTLTSTGNVWDDDGTTVPIQTHD